MSLLPLTDDRPSAVACALTLFLHRDGHVPGALLCEELDGGMDGVRDALFAHSTAQQGLTCPVVLGVVGWAVVAVSWLCTSRRGKPERL